ncbi:MAG: hypothetical protein AB7F35_14320 [Acetobacteraceae bacterium]
MSNETSLDAATALLRAGGAIAPPEVDEVVSVIRSGDQFLLSPTPGSPQSGTTHGLPDFFVGAVVIEWGYEVEPQSAAQFRRWLQDNEATLASQVPEGISYRGTYAVFAQSDLSLGAYRTVWAFASLDALQKMDMACGDDSSVFGRLVKELASFRDQRIGASRSQQIYQPAAISRRV